MVKMGGDFIFMKNTLGFAKILQLIDHNCTKVFPQGVYAPCERWNASRSRVRHTIPSTRNPSNPVETLGWTSRHGHIVNAKVGRNPKPSEDRVKADANLLFEGGVPDMDMITSKQMNIK